MHVIDCWMLFTQELQDLECPSPNPSPCRPPKGLLVATHPSKGSCSGPPIIMALALPLTKGPTEVPKALLLFKALTGQPDTPMALQYLPMPLCLLIAGLPFTILMRPSPSHQIMLSWLLIVNHTWLTVFCLECFIYFAWSRKAGAHVKYAWT